MKLKFPLRKILTVLLTSLFVASIVYADDVTYITHREDGTSIAVFTQTNDPHFGKVWKDPSGTIWSTYQGNYANNAIEPDQNNVVVDSAATEACAKIGGNLPTLQNYENLASYFEVGIAQNLTGQGKKDLYALFPDMVGPLDITGQPESRLFWSLSLISNSSDFFAPGAYAFSGTYGIIGFTNSLRSYSYSVRCVAK